MRIEGGNFVLQFFKTLGFVEGDVVTYLDGKHIVSYDAAIEAITQSELNDSRTLQVKLLRNGKPYTLNFRVNDANAN